MWWLQISEVSILGVKTTQMGCQHWLYSLVAYFSSQRSRLLQLKGLLAFSPNFLNLFLFHGKVEANNYKLTKPYWAQTVMKKWNGMAVESGFGLVSWFSTTKNWMIQGEKRSMISIEKDWPRIQDKKKKKTTHKTFRAPSEWQIYITVTDFYFLWLQNRCRLWLQPSN